MRGSERAVQPPRHRLEPVQVRPRPPDHPQVGAPDRVFPELLGVHASSGRCPGLSRRPYFTRPSNSPTVRSSGQPKSTNPSSRPSGPWTSYCRTGAGRPARHIATRLRDSPGLLAPPSAKETSRRAADRPTRPLPARASSMPGRSSRGGRSPGRGASAASATTTARSNGTLPATSTTVRPGQVSRTSPSRTISAASSRPTCRCTPRVTRPPPVPSRLTWTRSRGTSHTGRPHSTAADWWLTTHPGARCGNVAWTRSACRASGVSGPSTGPAR